MSNAKHKAVFMDRDNTLIEDPGYINHPDQVKLLPGAAASLVQLRKMGFLVLVVTNQSGVARGILTEEMLAQIHHQLEKLLADEGAYLDAIYYCPYHPDGVIPKYRMESEMRKPAPGMLLKAAEDLNINLSGSWLIGDSYRDIEAGKRAGCKTVLINNPVKPVQKNPSDPPADRQAVNIREAVNIIRMYELRQSMETALEHKHHEPTEANPSQITQPPPVSEDFGQCSTITGQETPNIEAPNVSEGIEDETKSSEQALFSQFAEEPADIVYIPLTEEPVSGQPDTSKESLETKSSKPLEPKASPKPAKTQGSPAVLPDDEPHLSLRTEKLLQEVLSHLRSVHRIKQYEDFTISKVLAGMAQVLAVACLVVSLWFAMDSTRGRESVLIMLGYTAVLQLMAIAFYVMRER